MYTLKPQCGVVKLKAQKPHALVKLMTSYDCNITNNVNTLSCTHKQYDISDKINISIYTLRAYSY